MTNKLQTNKQSTKLAVLTAGLSEISEKLKQGVQLNASQSVKLASILKTAADALGQIPGVMYDVNSCKQILRDQGVDESRLYVCDDQFGGPSSVSVTTPKMAVKSASIPYHQLAFDYTHNQLGPEAPPITNVKSASLPDHMITQLNSPTHRNKRYIARKESTRQLKSANTDSDNRPYFTYWKYSD